MGRGVFITRVEAQDQVICDGKEQGRAGMGRSEMNDDAGRNEGDILEGAEGDNIGRSEGECLRTFGAWEYRK